MRGNSSGLFNAIIIGTWCVYCTAFSSIWPDPAHNSHHVDICSFFPHLVSPFRPVFLFRFFLGWSGGTENYRDCITWRRNHETSPLLNFWGFFFNFSCEARFVQWRELMVALVRQTVIYWSFYVRTLRRNKLWNRYHSILCWHTGCVCRPRDLFLLRCNINYVELKAKLVIMFS